MTLAEYEALLIHAIERKVITIEEAAILFDRFKAGDFDEDELPLHVAEIQRIQRDDDELLALLLLLTLQSDSQSAKAKLRNANRRRDIAALTNVITGIESVRQFQQDFSETVQRSILKQWTGGARRQGWTDDIEAMIVEQLAYAERFAADVHFRREVERPLGTAEALNRGLMYAGAAWAAGYMGNEDGGSSYGWVYEYQPVDDRKTCSPCSRARGFYLANEGPIPGSICFGGHRCRCRRVAVYDVDIYRRLTGE